jgi:glycosyltransferase involved in cell wall biosynthesis
MVDKASSHRGSVPQELQSGQHDEAVASAPAQERMMVFAHLLNDRSGSTRVLRSIIAGIGTPTSNLLFVGGMAGGLLDEANGRVSRYWYRRGRNRWTTLPAYLLSQIVLFYVLCRDRRIARDAVIYVNTMMPFGAALFGWVTHRVVVYHLHEVSVRPWLLRSFLTGIARLTAARLIYVSDAHRATLPVAPARAMTIHNAVDPSLLRIASEMKLRTPPRPFTVVMLCYNRKFKGVPAFFELAARLADRDDIRFHLVLSDGLDEAEARPHGANITLFPPTDRPEDHYRSAAVVANLSRPDLCVETFGLTLLEGMAFGVPVIAPPVGGPAELVRNGQEGLLIDSRDIDALVMGVTRLADDDALWRTLSVAARHRALEFSTDRFHAAVRDAIRSALSPVRR